MSKYASLYGYETFVGGAYHIIDKNEEGKETQIAWIEEGTLKVTYQDDDARTDDYAQLFINNYIQTVKNIKEKNTPQYLLVWSNGTEISNTLFRTEGDAREKMKNEVLEYIDEETAEYFLNGNCDFSWISDTAAYLCPADSGVRIDGDAIWQIIPVYPYDESDEAYY